VSYKQSRSPNSGTVAKAKHSKESEYWLNQPATSNCSAVLQEEVSKEGQQRTRNSNTPKPPQIYVTGVQNISQMIQLLEQTAKEQYEIKALADNRVKLQPKTSEC
jgi:hypothetical protein